MIREWLTYITTSVDRRARKMGFLAECVAIEARHRRQAMAWSDHQQRTMQAISEAIAKCQQRRRVLVFGAALVLDLPLTELAANFQEVVLVDVLFLRSTRRRAAAFDNVTLLCHDLTQSLAEIEAGRAKAATPDRFLDQNDIDLVLSINILSQLAIIPNAYLSRRFGADETRDEAMGRALVQRHLDYLQRFDCRVLLVTDIERVIEDRAGFEVTRFSALFDVPIPQIGAEWDWQIAPYGEIDAQHQVTHRIRACCWGPDCGRSKAVVRLAGPPDMALTITGVAPHVAVTTDLAEALAGRLRAGDVLALSGDLGAGKSTFARAMIRSFDLQNADVPSPTFTLVQTYSGHQSQATEADQTAIEIAHFDFFRINDAFEAEEIGLEEFMSDHLCLIEWPQRVSAYLPASCLHLGFDIIAGDQRQITITGNSEWAARLAGISIGEDRQ